MPVRFRRFPHQKKTITNKPYAPLEKDICKSFYHQYRIRQQFNQIRNDILIYHIPNQQFTNIVYSIESKRMGMLAGVFDYTILIKGKGIAYIEFKRNAKCKLTPSQIAFTKILDLFGIKWLVTHDIEEAFKFIESL